MPLYLPGKKKNTVKDSSYYNGYPKTADVTEISWLQAMRPCKNCSSSRAQCVWWVEVSKSVLGVFAPVNRMLWADVKACGLGGWKWNIYIYAG